MLTEISLRASDHIACDADTPAVDGGADSMQCARRYNPEQSDRDGDGIGDEW
jgi:hypothetical protein